MATDKRFTYARGPADKSYGSSITIQVPTTSANQQQTSRNTDYNNNHHHNHNHNNSHNNANLWSYCYHQAATRSLLLADSGVSSSTTTDSDESPTPPPLYHEIPGIVPSYQGRTSGPPPSYSDVVNPNAPPPSYQSLFGQVREARKSSNGVVDLLRQLFLILIGTLGCTMIIGFLLLIPITMIMVGLIYVNDCNAENIPSFLVIGGLVWIAKNILNCYNQFKKDSTVTNRPPPPRRTSATLISPTVPVLAATSSPTSNSAATTTATTATALSSSGQQASTQASVILIGTSQTLGSNDTTATRNNSPASQPDGSHTTQSTATTRSTRSRDDTIRHPSLIGLTSFKCESMLNYFLVVWFLAGCIVVYRIYEPDYENPFSASYCNRTVYLYAFWLMTSAFIIMAIVLSCLCCLMASSLMSCNHGR